MQTFFKLGFYVLIVIPFFVGFAREWTPMLRPRGFVFAIFTHAVVLSAMYSRHQGMAVFFDGLVIICWMNLTLYGLARLIAIAAQGRFWNWIDSLTPEQLMARALIIATLLMAFLTSPKTQELKAAYQSAAQSLFLARR